MSEMSDLSDSIRIILNSIYILSFAIHFFLLLSYTTFIMRYGNSLFSQRLPDFVSNPDTGYSAKE